MLLPDGAREGQLPSGGEEARKQRSKRRVRLDLVPETIYEGEGVCNHHRSGEETRPQRRSALLRRQSTVGRLVPSTGDEGEVECRRLSGGNEASGTGRRRQLTSRHWYLSPLFCSKPRGPPNRPSLSSSALEEGHD